MFYGSDATQSTCNNLVSCILKRLWVIDLSLILFNSSWRIYLIKKKSKCTAVFLLINNETKCVP